MPQASPWREINCPIILKSIVLRQAKFFPFFFFSFNTLATTGKVSLGDWYSIHGYFICVSGCEVFSKYIVASGSIVVEKLLKIHVLWIWLCNFAKHFCNDKCDSMIVKYSDT